MAADLPVLKRPRRTFSVALATGPTHVTRTFVLGGAESGHVLEPLFYPVARLGPPLRACTVGDPVIYYGGNSYVRGGAPATGHAWKVYEFNATLTDGAYLADRGVEVVAGIVGAGTNLMTFTPSAPGTYAIELGLAGQLIGDGVTAPYGKGVRFLKVFAVGGYDLEGIPEIAGPNGSLDDGGVSLDLSYRRPDNLSGRQDVEHLKRVVVNKRLYYGTNTGPLEHYTWEPGDTIYAPEVLMSGLIDGSSIREDPETHEVSYRVAGAQLPLALAQVPTYTGQATGDSDPRTVWVPPTFMEADIWALLIATEPDATPGWMHIVTNLLASDPALHILQRHTNLLDWFDLALDQAATDVVQSAETSSGSIGDYLRGAQATRFGRVWTDRKSIIYLGPDDDLVENAFKPSPVIPLDGELYRSIRIAHPQPQVGQVYVEATLNYEATGIPVGIAGGIDAFEQRVVLVHKEALYPATALPGMRRSYGAARYFNQTALNTLTERLYARDNAKFPEIELDMGMFPHLDLGQPVTITLTPRTLEGWAAWHVAGLGPLRAYVVGYTNTLTPDGETWKTTLRLRESTFV